eukprot:11352512-Alexandrium_andersonii.AAC.1
MSASLVGSEMCIRDRLAPAARLPCRATGSPIPGCLSRRSHGREAARPPVSYTHLTLPTICSV